MESLTNGASNGAECQSAARGDTRGQFPPFLFVNEDALQRGLDQRGLD